MLASATLYFYCIGINWLHTFSTTKGPRLSWDRESQSRHDQDKSRPPGGDLFYFLVLPNVWLILESLGNKKKILKQSTNDNAFKMFLGDRRLCVHVQPAHPSGPAGRSRPVHVSDQHGSNDATGYSCSISCWTSCSISCSISCWTSKSITFQRPNIHFIAERQIRLIRFRGQRNFCKELIHGSFQAYVIILLLLSTMIIQVLFYLWSF
jgi:hypothetical protein